MSKNTGPCFEFELKKDGARVEFVFLPGNVSKKVFSDTIEGLKSAFDAQYGVSSNDYMRQITLDDGTKTLAIYQTKLLTVLKAILSSRIFSDFKTKVTGIDKNGAPKTKVISTPIEVKEAAEVIPYFNKRNNDITTRRSN